MKSNRFSREEARQLLINSIQENISTNNPTSTSSNNQINEKNTTFYSDYGYIEVLKDDYDNNDLLVIPFTSKNKLYGSILVSLITYYYKIRNLFVLLLLMLSSKLSMVKGEAILSMLILTI